MYTEQKISSTYHSLFFVANGEYILTMNDTNYLAPSGHFAFVPKNTAYSTRMPPSKKLELYEVLLNYDIGGKDFREVLNVKPEDCFVVKASHPDDVLWSFGHAFENTDSKPQVQAIANFHAGSAIVSFYASDLAAKNAVEKNASCSFSQVIEYMHKNIHKGINISELAGVMYLEPTYFISKFKSHYGVSPLQYFNSIRLEHALDMILNTDLSIGDIAESVGISDVYYFTRFFRKHGYSSPPEYRYALEQSDVTAYITPKKTRITEDLNTF